MFFNYVPILIAFAAQLIDVEKERSAQMYARIRSCFRIRGGILIQMSVFRGIFGVDIFGEKQKFVTQTSAFFLKEQEYKF